MIINNSIYIGNLDLLFDYLSYNKINYTITREEGKVLIETKEKISDEDIRRYIIREERKEKLIKLYGYDYTFKENSI